MTPGAAGAALAAEPSQNKGRPNSSQSTWPVQLAPSHTPRCAHLGRTAAAPVAVCADLVSPVPACACVCACVCAWIIVKTGALGLPSEPGARGPVSETMWALPGGERALQRRDYARADRDREPFQRITWAAGGETGTGEQFTLSKTRSHCECCWSPESTQDQSFTHSQTVAFSVFMSMLVSDLCSSLQYLY